MTESDDVGVALDAVPDRLEAMDGLPPVDQVDEYAALHATLSDVLARTADPGSPPAPGQ